MSIDNIEDAEVRHETNKDDAVIFEAAGAHSSGESRAAINSLIQRVNATGGKCDVRIWLMILDLYKIQGSQAPYEKLASHFSDIFGFSAPAWQIFEDPNKPKTFSASWRNALIVEGSPNSLNEEKIRDFLHASKEQKSSRLDLSRMRLSEKESERLKEISTITFIMQRLRKYECATLLMGESDMVETLKLRTKTGDNKFETEMPYWTLLFEVLQWRGREQEFDDLAMEFADKFEHCHVGYDVNGAIGVVPKTVTDGNDGYRPGDSILEADPILDLIQDGWSNGSDVVIDLSYVKRVGMDAARSIAELLQAQNGKPEQFIFKNPVEPIVSLLEMTGVTAFSTIIHRDPKLRQLNYNK